MPLAIQFRSSPAINLYRQLAGAHPSESTARLMDRIFEKLGLHPEDAEFRMLVMFTVISNNDTKELGKQATDLHEFTLREREIITQLRNDFLKRETELARTVLGRVDKADDIHKTIHREVRSLRGDFARSEKNWKFSFYSQIAILVLFVALRFLP